MVIEKPGEDFGVALYEWLASGKPEKPAAQAAPAAKTASKPQKSQAVPEKPKAENPGNALSLKEQGNELMKEIGAVITDSKGGVPYFTEDEKEEARKIVKETRLDEKGIADLEDFKGFLSEELAKRKSKKAA